MALTTDDQTTPHDATPIGHPAIHQGHFCQCGLNVADPIHTGILWGMTTADIPADAVRVNQGTPRRARRRRRR